LAGIFAQTVAFNAAFTTMGWPTTCTKALSTVRQHGAGHVPPPGGWPGEHSVLYAVLSAAAIIAVFAPLTVVRYRRLARR
jgi:hypothetical protein